MNVSLLNSIAAHALNYPKSVDLLCTIDMQGLSLEKEESLTLTEAFEKLRSEDGSIVDLSTLAVLLCRERFPRLRLYSTYLASAAYDVLDLPPDDLNRLDCLAYWPTHYQEPYRIAFKAGDYSRCAQIINERIHYFIVTKGRE